MNGGNPQILFSISTIIQLLFLLGAIGFVATRSDDGSSAKSRALIGLFLIFVVYLGAWIVNTFLMRFIAPDRTMLVHGVLSIVYAVLWCIGLTLLVSAVFKERGWRHQKASTGVDGTFDDDNPYATPRR